MLYYLVTGALTTAQTCVDLAPGARDLELGWSTTRASGAGRLGITHAGHIAGSSDTAGFLSLVLR